MIDASGSLVILKWSKNHYLNITILWATVASVETAASLYDSKNQLWLINFPLFYPCIPVIIFDPDIDFIIALGYVSNFRIKF